MFILWTAMWFVVGFLTVLTIRNIKERRETEKAIMEQLMLHEALSEKTPTEINALYTTLGVRNAQWLILSNYKIKHGHTIK